MKSCWVSIAAALFLLFPNTVLLQLKAGSNPKQHLTPQSNEYQEELFKIKAQKEKDFEPMRQLLLQKGVPFDPDILLDDDWPTKLAYVFEQIPEMQTNRYESKPLKGAQLAGVLYLPNYVELEGDTIILAKKIVLKVMMQLLADNIIYIFYLLKPPA